MSDSTVTSPTLPTPPQADGRHPDFFQRFLTFPAAILSLLVLVVAFGRVQTSIVEPDMWWHLRNAQQIVANHAMPRFDTYSFTASGAPWIDHEWLSEVLYYGAYKLLGLRGITALFFSIAIISFFILYYLCCRAGANPKTAGIITILGIMVAAVSFGPRMLLFGWLAMCGLLVILQKYDNQRSGPLWALPLLFGVWVNLHGSWLFGLLVLFGFIACGFFEFEIGNLVARRFTPAELKQLLTFAMLSVFALFINPFGYHLVAYPFDLMLRQKTNIEHIEEWQSVNFHDPRGKIVMVLLLALLGSSFLSKRKLKLHEALIGAFALYSSLTYWRMQYFAALILVPIIATRIVLFPDYEPEKEKPVLNGLIMVSVIALMAWKFPSEQKLQKTIEAHFPEAALQYMEQHGMTDRVMDEYAYGGYMIWRTPNIKTFIDGRADLFVYNGIFDEYVQFSHISGALDVLDKHKIQYVLLSNEDPDTYLLDHVPAWHKVYGDNLATIFERTNRMP